MREFETNRTLQADIDSFSHEPLNKPEFNRIIRIIVDALLDKHRVVVYPVPVIRIAAHEGLKVEYFVLSKGSGIFLPDTRRILVSSYDIPIIQRAVVAHELGHHIAREPIPKSGLLDDYYRQIRNFLTHEETEAFCEAFAANLLVPDRLLAQPSLRSTFVNSGDADLESLADELQVPTYMLEWRIGQFLSERPLDGSSHAPRPQQLQFWSY